MSEVFETQTHLDSATVVLHTQVILRVSRSVRVRKGRKACILFMQCEGVYLIIADKRSGLIQSWG
jgi:hypothetical protein